LVKQKIIKNKKYKKEVKTMIDFQKAAFFKLKQVEDNSFDELVTPILVDGEQLISTFQSIRDGVIFTTKRIITINIQGVTGKKKDITSLPYSKIQAFSVETAGVIDLDSELELWFSGLGKVKLEFTGKTKIIDICKLLSDSIL
jgi:hypothetical protein